MREPALARLPPRGAPLPERLFRYLLDLEIEKANRLRYCLSLVCLTPDLEGSQVGADLTRAIARIALRQLRGTDLATTLSRETVALLLVDTDPTMLTRILDRTANAQLPEGRRFVRGRQIVSVSVGASCYPLTAPDRATLLREANDLMHRARREGGDRLILPPFPLPTLNN
jgi:GGDEF domain-containing protein